MKQSSGSPSIGYEILKIVREVLSMQKLFTNWMDFAQSWILIEIRLRKISKKYSNKLNNVGTGWLVLAQNRFISLLVYIKRTIFLHSTYCIQLHSISNEKELWRHVRYVRQFRHWKTTQNGQQAVQYFGDSVPVKYNWL